MWGFWWCWVFYPFVREIGLSSLHMVICIHPTEGSFTWENESRDGSSPLRARCAGVALHPPDSWWDLFSLSSSARPVLPGVVGTPLLLLGLHVRAVRRQRLPRTEEQL